MKKKYIFAIIGVTALGSMLAQNPATNIDSALIACYPFNGNAVDGTGNGNNGTVNGATLVNDRFGNSNSAYMFNGSSNNIVIPSFNTKINSNEFSLSFWATATSYATRSPFLLSPDITTNRLNVHIYYGSSSANSQTIFDWGNISGGRLSVSGSTLPAVGTWDHWVFVVSAANGFMKCYKNGTLAFTKVGCSTLNTATTQRDLLIGGGVGSGSSLLWFDGSLDDVKLYNRILTQSDVNKLFTQTITCQGAMGINEYINNAIRFQVYPNPSNTGIYTISDLSGTSSEITVTTLTGEVIKIFNASAESAQLDLKQCASGIYFLNIKNSAGTYTQKLIKE